MSKRTLRRAAERQALKADSAFASTTQSAAPTATEPFTMQSAEIAMAAPTASAAQINANRENAQLSCGPVTPEGKAIVSQNRRTHGLAGGFTVLAWECVEDFQTLVVAVYQEYCPETDTEHRLADCLIQHYWLKERAVRLQEDLLTHSADPTEVNSKKLSLFLRYQSTHERSYYKAQRELQNLKKQKRQNEIGFESQKRAQEAHDARIRLTHARAQNLEIDTACRQVMDVPVPGNETIGFEQLTQACSSAIASVYMKKQQASAAAA